MELIEFTFQNYGLHFLKEDSMQTNFEFELAEAQYNNISVKGLKISSSGEYSPEELRTIGDLTKDIISKYCETAQLFLEKTEL